MSSTHSSQSTQTWRSLLLRCLRRLWATNEQLARDLSRRQYEVAWTYVKSNWIKINQSFLSLKSDRYLRQSVVGSSTSAFNSNNRATSAALPASVARYIFVRPSSSRALISSGVAVVVVAIESVCAEQVCFVLFWPEKNKKRERNETKKEKSDKDQRLFENKK